MKLHQYYTITELNTLLALNERTLRQARQQKRVFADSQGRLNLADLLDAVQQKRLLNKGNTKKAKIALAKTLVAHLNTLLKNKSFDRETVILFAELMATLKSLNLLFDKKQSSGQVEFQLIEEHAIVL